jgi:hypothetical protein
MPNKQNLTLTVSATSQTALLPPRCVAVVLRALETNAATSYFQFNSPTATTGDSRLRVSETLAIDYTDMLQLKVLIGEDLNDNDFMRCISYVGNAADVILVEAFTL